MLNRGDFLDRAVVIVLGVGGLLLTAQTAFATSAPSSYGVYLQEGGGAVPLPNDVHPDQTSGTIGSGSNSGSVNLLSGQIAASSLTNTVDATGVNTSVAGWDTWTFHSGSSAGGTATLQMTGTFNYGSQAGGMFGSGGEASLCQGFEIAGCLPGPNGNGIGLPQQPPGEQGPYGPGSTPFKLDYSFSVNNGESLMLTYALSTQSFGSLASFDPTVSLLLPSGWSATSAATPEPSTWLLFGTGMILMGVMGLRKRNEFLTRT